MSARWLLAACVAVACSSGRDASHAHDEKREGHAEHDEHEGHAEEGVVALTPEAAARAGIRTAPVELRPLAAELRSTARVGFDEERVAHVSPRIPGRVAEVKGRLGQDVKAGDPLAVIESVELGEAKAEYLRVRAEAELTAQTLQREERLFADKITSEQSVIEARTAHRKATTTRETAAERLRLLGLTDKEIARLRYGDPKAPLYTLRAPVAGRVVEKHLALGEQVTPEEPCFTIADPTHLWIWIDIFERDLSRVHVGDEVTVVTTAWPDRVFRGQVAHLGAQIDPGTRAARARIDLVDTEGALKPGMFAEVTITDPHATSGAGPRPTVTAVPASALQRDGDGWIAFVAAGDHRFERRAVRTGERGTDFVEVVDGLRPGEQVVVEGAFFLKSAAARGEMGGGHSH